MGRNRGAHIGQALQALRTCKGTITCEDRVQSLSQFAERVASLAAGLSREGGLQPGDRVAIAALNRSDIQVSLSVIVRRPLCGEFSDINYDVF